MASQGSFPVRHSKSFLASGPGFNSTSLQHKIQLITNSNTPSLFFCCDHMHMHLVCETCPLRHEVEKHSHKLATDGLKTNYAQASSLVAQIVLQIDQLCYSQQNMRILCYYQGYQEKSPKGVTYCCCICSTLTHTETDRDRERDGSQSTHLYK